MPDSKNPARETDPPPSVLHVIKAKTGETPHVSLRDEPSQLSASPILAPDSDETRALPRGRGNYQMMGEIARGGMGVVLKGHDSDLGRDVALKVLNRDLVDRPDVVQRFVEEAQIGGQLQHPGIVPVYELGLMADERPYFTMKLVKGRTLAMLLAERKSPEDGRRRLLDVFLSICQTMAYAHSRGVLHRDLKPANVMVGAFGEVQVVDWGLAKVLAHGGKADERRAKEARAVQTVLETVRTGKDGSGSGSGSDSLVGSVMGTPEYMSPEQAQGHVDRLDERSDVFSLGAILCEILTGYPPYHREESQGNTLTDAALGRTDLASDRLDACTADAELVELTRECLLAPPAARPHHAGVLAERLQEHLTSVEERARAAQIEAAVQRRGRKLTVALAATILVASLGSGGGWLWVQQKEIAREREVARRDENVRGAVDLALDEASRAQGEGRWDDALASIGRASVVADTGQAGPSVLQRIADLETAVTAAAEADRVQKERAAENARFLARLEDASMNVAGIGLHADTERDCLAAFADAGIDVGGLEPQAVAAALRERGIGTEIAPALHRWIIARRMISLEQAEEAGRPEYVEPVLHLVEIAHEMDDDPLHADLREAMLNDELSILNDLAAGDLSELGPSTIELLGIALGFAKEWEAAARVLDQGVRQYPGSYSMQLAAAFSMNGVDPALELARLRAAQALRPDNPGVRRMLFFVQRSLASKAMVRGDTQAARRLNQAAIDELEARIAATEDTPSWEHGWLANALQDQGDLDGALAQLLIAMERPPVASNPYVHASLGEMRLLRGEIAEAVQVFERLVELAPTSLNYARWCQAMILQDALDGDTEHALLVVDEYCKQSLDPVYGPDELGVQVCWFSMDEVHGLLGATDRETQERIESVFAVLYDDLLQRLEQVEPPSGHVLRRRAILRVRMGDDDAALAEMMRANELVGTYREPFWIALLHARAGRVDEGMSWYERGLARIVEFDPRPGYAVTFDTIVRLRTQVARALGVEDR